jgi:regulator of replication initiation timing
MDQDEIRKDLQEIEESVGHISMALRDFCLAITLRSNEHDIRILQLENEHLKEKGTHKDFYRIVNTIFQLVTPITTIIIIYLLLHN